MIRQRPATFNLDASKRNVIHPCVSHRQSLRKRLLDLVVGKSQSIETVAVVIRNEILDRQVARLEQQGHDLRRLWFVRPQLRLQDLEIRNVNRTLLQQLHQERRRTRLVPIALELAVAEASPERYGIDHPLGGMMEAIPVVHRDDLVERLVRCETVRRAKRREMLAKVFLHLVVRVAEHRRRPRVHREIHEVVEVREDRHLRELAHARDEGEALRALAGFDDRVEFLQRIANLADIRLAKMSQDRLVIFIDEQNHLPLNVTRQRLTPRFRRHEDLVAVAAGQVFNKKTKLRRRTLPAQRNLKSVRF